jgi:hypothetical protein
MAAASFGGIFAGFMAIRKYLSALREVCGGGQHSARTWCSDG